MPSESVSLTQSCIPASARLASLFPDTSSPQQSVFPPKFLSKIVIFYNAFNLFFTYDTILYHFCELLDLYLVLIVEVAEDVLLAVVCHFGHAVLPVKAVPVLSDGPTNREDEPLHHVAPHLQTFLQLMRKTTSITTNILILTWL